MIDNSTTLYPIGHGRHAWKDFFALLQKHEIEFLCDVRSFARSRWVQFNGKVLEANLRENGIGYEWLPETGGKFKPIPEDLTRGIERNSVKKPAQENIAKKSSTDDSFRGLFSLIKLEA